MHVLRDMSANVKAFFARGPVFGLLLCLPALILMAFVLVYPLLRSISLSFQRMNLVYPASNKPFVGLENYIRLFTLEPYFGQVLVTNRAICDYHSVLRLRARFHPGADPGKGSERHEPFCKPCSCCPTSCHPSP